MAEVAHSTARAFNRRVITWSAMANGDTAEAFYLDDDALTGALQVSGTFGGATITFQGSVDGSNYVNLEDSNGDAISATAGALYEISTSVLYVKPVLTGGAGSSITVTLIQRSGLTIGA